jgi:hypothetical protein
MKTKEELRLEIRITSIILEVANAHPDIPNSDLQGIAQARAQDIIREVRQAK